MKIRLTTIICLNLWNNLGIIGTLWDFQKLQVKNSYGSLKKVCDQIDFLMNDKLQKCSQFCTLLKPVQRQ